MSSPEFGYIPDYLIALNKLKDEDGKEHSPIKLIIDSPGGSVKDMFAIIDTIEVIKSPVWTYARDAKSAAAVIFACGAPGRRYVFERARLMIHQAKDYLIGFFLGVIITADDHERRAKELRISMERIADVLVDNLCPGATTTKKQILEDMEKEKWMSAQESIDYGIADVIIGEGAL